VFCGDGETGPFLRAPEKTRGRFYWSFPESPRPFWDSLYFHDLWLDILDGNVLFRICFPHSLMAGWSHWVVKSLETRDSSTVLNGRPSKHGDFFYSVVSSATH